MIKLAVIWIVISVSVPFAFSQNPATVHVFPQIADGRQSDGSYYTSFIWITNLSGFDTACDISLFGMGTERLSSPPAINISSGSWISISTRAQDPIASGYARLDCTQPVGASLTFVLLDLTGKPLGMTTVTSATTASYAMLPLRLTGSIRYGFAISNDNDLPLTVSLVVSGPNGSGGGQTLQIPPRSQYARFVDEIFSLTTQGAATLEISANGSVGSGNFNATGFLFDRGAFTSLAAATTR